MFKRMGDRFLREQTFKSFQLDIGDTNHKFIKLEIKSNIYFKKMIQLQWFSIVKDAFFLYCQNIPWQCKHLISLVFGLSPDHPRFKHGFTCWEKNTNMIYTKLNKTPKWDPLGFRNNSLELSIHSTKRPQSHKATTKSTLNLLLIYWIEGCLFKD